jgi:hypothetical protein
MSARNVKLAASVKSSERFDFRPQSRRPDWANFSPLFPRKIPGKIQRIFFHLIMLMKMRILCGNSFFKNLFFPRKKFRGKNVRKMYPRLGYFCTFGRFSNFRHFLIHKAHINCNVGNFFPRKLYIKSDKM